MAALFALSAAVAYGVGDFLGGVAARRVPPTAVVLWSHIVGLMLLVTLAPLAGGDLTTRALAVGAVAGVLGGAGVALFYRGLAVGTMSVIAPIAALLSATVPVVVGVGSGERPSGAVLAGIVLALGAVVLISREAPHVPRSTHRWLALGLAVAAGLAFGLFFVAIDRAGAGSSVGIWPLVGARVASVSLFAGLGAAKVTSAALPRAAATSSPRSCRGQGRRRPWRSAAPTARRCRPRSRTPDGPACAGSASSPTCRRSASRCST